jgi:hypothetical protein
MLQKTHKCQWRGSRQLLPCKRQQFVNGLCSVQSSGIVCARKCLALPLLINDILLCTVKIHTICSLCLWWFVVVVVFKLLLVFTRLCCWNSKVREEWLSMDSLCRYCLRYVMARADAAEAYVQVKVLAVAAVLLKRGWWVQFSVAFLWLGSFINHHKTRFIHASASICAPEKSLVSSILSSISMAWKFYKMPYDLSLWMQPVLFLSQKFLSG